MEHYCRFHFRSETVLADRPEEEGPLLGSARSPGARPKQIREGLSLGVTRGERAEAGSSRAVTPTIEEEPGDPEERDRLL